MNKIEDLKNKLQQIAVRISSTTDIGDQLALKRQKYNLKLELLDCISQKEIRAGISARELRSKFLLKEKAPIYATGIEALDNELDGGFEQGSFIQLAGASFVGKTHLLLDILSNIAEFNKCVFFNFEMGEKRIVNRLERLLTKDEQWDNLIVDSDSRNLKDLVMEISLYAEDGIKFFMIDSKMKLYVDNMSDDHKQFSFISKELSRLAQQKDIIILFINQMSEDDLKNKRLAFKGSGDQQYDSDISLFYVLDEKTKERTLICNKNRTLNEKLFMLPLVLDHNGKTKGKNTYSRVPVMTEYQSTEVEIPDIF